MFVNLNFNFMKRANRFFALLLVFISISGCRSIYKLPLNVNSRAAGADVEVKQKPNRIAAANKTTVTLKLPSNKQKR